MGEVYCWGINDLAIVPANSDPSRIVVVPELVDVPTRAAVTAIDLSGHHACALTASGSLFCWGTNGDLAIGPGQFTAAPRCQQLPGNAATHADRRHHGTRHAAGEPGVDWRSRILRTPDQRADCVLGPSAASVRHSRADRAIVARRGALLRDRWGRAALRGRWRSRGRLAPTPQANVGPWRWRASIATTGKWTPATTVTCAIGYDEQVYCWGDSSFGSLGLGLGAFDVVEPTALLFADLFQLPPAAPEPRTGAA